jgi:hypothetical protein
VALREKREREKEFNACLVEVSVLLFVASKRSFYREHSTCDPIPNAHLPLHNIITLIITSHRKKERERALGS